MSEIFKQVPGASLLLRLVAGETDFPQIEGDLREECHQREIASGIAAAREWYRHEALRNTWVLARSKTTILAFLSAGLGAILLYWSTPLLFFGQHLANAITSAIVMQRPVWDFVSNHFWAVSRSRGTPFAILLSPLDPWVIPLFRIVSAFCFGMLSTRMFPDRVWLMRLAFVGWNFALLPYFTLNPLLYGVCWFLLGSAYCSQRIRRRLAV